MDRNKIDPFTRTKRNAEAGVASVTNLLRVWKLSYGTSRVDETKGYEEKVLAGVAEINALMGELESRAEETPSLEEAEVRKKFIAEVKAKLIGWENLINTVRSQRRVEVLNEGPGSREPSQTLGANSRPGLGATPGYGTTPGSGATLGSGSPASYGTSPEEESHYQKTQAMEEAEDERLTAISRTTRTMKTMAGDMSKVLDQHIEELSEVEDDADQVQNRLQEENKFLNKLSKYTSERKSWVIIVVLGVLFVILIAVALGVP